VKIRPGAQKIRATGYPASTLLFGRHGAGIAHRPQARHDSGSQYVSDDFETVLKFLGIASSPAFVRESEGNEIPEHATRTLLEQPLWVRTFDTVEDLRWAGCPRVQGPVQSGLALWTSRASKAEAGARAAPGTGGGTAPERPGGETSSAEIPGSILRVRGPYLDINQNPGQSAHQPVATNSVSAKWRTVQRYPAPARVRSGQITCSRTGQVIRSPK
jgi:hypothetical protein